MTASRAISGCLIAGAICLLSSRQTQINAQESRSASGQLEDKQLPRSLIGIQYENWFTRHDATWDTAEATPVLGKYSSYDPSVLKKHFEMFQFLGIDWLLIDWSNMLWSKPAWEQHTGSTRELEDTVAVMFKTARQLQAQGKYAPKMVFMLGLQNGPPVPDGVKRLNGIIAWIKKNYLDKPEYKDLWLNYQGNPLLTILYFPADPCKQLKSDLAESRVESSGWTVRWMASQLQFNHAEQCGMWSWMDGDIRQVVTSHHAKPEEVVVTPACFQLPGKGWRHPSATGRDHGAPYIESWRVAFETRPAFIQIHQWNEFAGQKEDEGMPDEYWKEQNKAQTRRTTIYGDEYNLELSDDIEPTRMEGCAYRGCGGWGYYYVNLSKALIALYRGETPDATVMALSAPFQTETVNAKTLPLRWSTIGKSPAAYTISVDGRPVVRAVKGSEYSLNVSQLAAGKHRISLLAEGAEAYYDLNPAKLTSKSSRPLPVQSEIQFTYSPQ